jgi:hypothetical protein
VAPPGSISRELGYTISPNLPPALLFSPTDRLKSFSLCQRAMPSLYRIHISEGPAAQNIIRDISVRITTEMSLSFGRCCVGKHTRECPQQQLLRRLHGTCLSPAPGQAWHPPLLCLLRLCTTNLSGPPTTIRLLRTRRPRPKTLANIIRNPRRTTTPRRNNAYTHNHPQSAPP